MPTTTTTVREWSTPEKTKITGQPPGPDTRVTHTSRGEHRRQDFRVVTPIYKADPLTTNLPGSGTTVHLQSETKAFPNFGYGAPDYKVEKERESYRLHIIDPKVDGHYRSNAPLLNNIPSYIKKRNKTPDFPSAHSKRSFLKLDALENRRLKSYETKIISPQEYLNESLQRHRSLSMSSLRDRLNLHDKDVNLPWDPAAHPGPRSKLFEREEQFLKSQLTGSRAKKQEVSRDLDELARRRQGLFDRSKNRSLLNIRELRKVDPNYIDVPEREFSDDFLDSKVDYLSRSSKSSGRDLLRSQSVMSTEWENYDKHISKTRSQTNLASWQFNNASFSPRSVINVNGHQNDTGLLRIRTDLSPAPARVAVPLQVPIVQKSNAAVQTQTKTEQVTSTTVNQQQTQQPPPYWNMPTGIMPQIVFVPIGTTGSAPGTLTRETVKEEKIRYVRDHDYPSDTDSKQGTLIRIKDDSGRKPKPSGRHKKHVVKKTEEHREEFENLGDRDKQIVALPPAPLIVQEAEQVASAPKVTETVSTVEETTRTEEVERRVKNDSKKHKREKHSHKKGQRHSSSHGNRHHYQEQLGYYDDQGRALDYPSWTTSGGDPRHSPWRQQGITPPNGYYPAITESYHKHSSSRRIHDSEPDEFGHDHMNGHLYRGGNDRFHRSYSSNNVYHNRTNDRPIVEYPPSIQRSTAVYRDDRSYNQHGARHLGRQGRKWESEISATGTERDYKDSLLMHMPRPGQNIDEREYRHEAIPGGHETFSRNTKSNSGFRNEGNGTTHFSEAKQDTSFKREQTSERRY